jgi:hypothetical protein
MLWSVIRPRGSQRPANLGPSHVNRRGHRRRIEGTTSVGRPPLRSHDLAQLSLIDSPLPGVHR